MGADGDEFKGLRPLTPPAIQYLLIEAAIQLHSGPGIFQKAGQFPAAESIDLPLSKSALQHYKSEGPLLQQYLPFWLAVLAQQLLVLMIPVLGVIYPLMRFTPALYGWGMRRRIVRLCGELKFLESELDRRSSEGKTEDLSARFELLEKRANAMRVPASFAH